MNIIKYVYIIFLILVIVNSYNNTKANSTQNLDTVKVSNFTVKQNVVVTASRSNKNLLDIPFSVTSINDENIIYNNSRSTPETLMGNAGIFIQKTNHGGGSPFLRGLTGYQTLILVDGIRLNNSTFRSGPNQYLNTIDPNTLGNIEIMRGGGSVQYGSDAIGGTLQLFTKNPKFSDDLNYNINGQVKSISNDQEYSGRAELEFSDKNLALLSGISYQKFGNLYGGKNTGVQSPSGYEQMSFDAKLNYKIFDNSILTFYSSSLNQINVPLIHRVQLENFEYYNFEPQFRNSNYIKLTSNYENSLFKNINYTLLNTNWEEGRVSKKNNNINEISEYDKIRTLGGIIDVLSEYTENWTASSGIEYYNDFVNSRKNTLNTETKNIINSRGLYPNNSSYNNLSVFTMHSYKLDDFIFDFGFRYNYFDIMLTDENLGKINFNTDAFVWNIGSVYKLNDYSSVFGLLSTSFRAPNIDDMGTLGIVDFRYEVPNYNLKPEKSLNTELGYKYLGENMFFTFSIYRNNLSNFINRVRGQYNGLDSVSSYPVFLKTNSFESYIQGIELDFQTKITENIDITTNLTYAYGQNISANEPMRRIPPLNGKIAFNYSIKSLNNLNMRLETLFADSQLRLAAGDKSDNRINPNGTVGFAIFNLVSKIDYDKFSIVGGFENILNKDYRYHGSGINGMGRSAYLKFIFNNFRF